MAVAIVSAVAEQLISFVKEQIQNEPQPQLLSTGVRKELLDLSDMLNNIRNVLDDAERQQFKEKTIKDWLRRLEQTSYEMEDVLDEWNYFILKSKMESESDHPLKQKVCSFIPSSCFCFKKEVVRHRDIAKKIKILKPRLYDILNEKGIRDFVISQPKYDPSYASRRVESTPLIDPEEIFGRTDDIDILVSKLTANDGSHERIDNCILSIVGGGGLGKTTLAQLVYNDSRVKACFDVRIWLCVADPFDVGAIAKKIITSIGEGSCPDTNQLDVLLKVLVDSILGKKFILVLDDVWDLFTKHVHWTALKNSLKCGGASSKILVTTRNEKVAQFMCQIDENIHRLQLLSDEDCWLVLRSKVFFGWSENDRFENFVEMGKVFAKKCKGLPLAAKTLASLLCFKRTIKEWEEVLKSEMWELEEVKIELFPHLLVSYLELSPTLRRCFSFCAFFSNDEEIEVEQLIRIWMALGYLGSNIGSADESLELKGREYFKDLAMRSLFQDFRKHDITEEIMSFKIHDIVHDFARFLSDERFNSSGITCEVCDPFSKSQVQKYRSLFWCEESRTPKICDCLTSLRVLGFKSIWSGIPDGMEKLIHLRWLDMSNCGLSKEDLKTICKLYLLQTLLLVSCSLKEIPEEIGNLVHLRHLHLRFNRQLKELPESMCRLVELQTLDIEGCWILCGLPEGVHGLINLKHIVNGDTPVSCCFPEGVGQLSGLRTLSEFHGGSGCNKLGLLKDLNSLTGLLNLEIKFTNASEMEELVEDAQTAELRRKIYIQALHIRFNDETDGSEPLSSSMWVDLIEALEPNQTLKFLKIWRYKGYRLPHWISSPLNQVRNIELINCSEVRSLPPMGKLPFLEELSMYGLEELKFVGKEWLGIRRGEGEVMEIQSSYSSLTDAVVFPKLKKLAFDAFHKWEEWEDITAQEGEDAAILVMPCLTELHIRWCERLKMLPHGLLRKAECLRVLDISYSQELCKCYEDKDDSLWRSISENNPQLQLQMD